MVVEQFRPAKPWKVELAAPRHRLVYEVDDRCVRVLITGAPEVVVPVSISPSFAGSTHRRLDVTDA